MKRPGSGARPGAVPRAGPPDVPAEWPPPACRRPASRPHAPPSSVLPLSSASHGAPSPRRRWRARRARQVAVEPADGLPPHRARELGFEVTGEAESTRLARAGLARPITPRSRGRRLEGSRRVAPAGRSLRPGASRRRRDRVRRHGVRLHALRIRRLLPCARAPPRRRASRRSRLAAPAAAPPPRDAGRRVPRGTWGRSQDTTKTTARGAPRRRDVLRRADPLRTVPGARHPPAHRLGPRAPPWRCLRPVSLRPQATAFRPGGTGSGPSAGDCGSERPRDGGPTHRAGRRRHGSVRGPASTRRHRARRGLPGPPQRASPRPGPERRGGPSDARLEDARGGGWRRALPPPRAPPSRRCSGRDGLRRAGGSVQRRSPVPRCALARGRGHRSPPPTPRPAPTRAAAARGRQSDRRPGPRTDALRRARRQPEPAHAPPRARSSRCWRTRGTPRRRVPARPPASARRPARPR